MRRNPKWLALTVLTLAIALMATAPVAAIEIQGTLTLLEADDHVFTVTDEFGSEHEFRLRLDGAVYINDEERTIWDLEPGDQLQVTYEIEAYQGLVATMIRCTRN